MDPQNLPLTSKRGFPLSTPSPKKVHGVPADTPGTIFFITGAKTHVDVRKLTIHTSSFLGTSQNRDFQLKDSEAFLCWLNAITVSPKKGFAEAPGTCHIEGKNEKPPSVYYRF
jgi:hypothetical protein